MIPIVYLSVAYAFSEFVLMLIKHSKIKAVKMRNDRGSMILIWCAISFGITGGFFLSESVNDFWAGFGLVFIIAGIIIRWISIIQLGKSFTVDVAITDASKLKTDGLYEKVRHPSYLGLLLIIIGFSLTMYSFYSFLVLVVPVFLAISYRISVEEKVLMNEFGDSYNKYKTATKRIIPGIY